MGADNSPEFSIQADLRHQMSIPQIRKEKQRMAPKMVILVTTMMFVSLELAFGASLNERGLCKDTSPNCEKWALEGMCKQDPDMEAFMGRRCPFACDTCGARNKRRVMNARTACEDLDPACEEMAIEGLCFDPEYQTFMEKTCAFACDVCSSRKRRRARAIAELSLDAAAIDAAATAAAADDNAVAKRSVCEDFSPKCEAFASDGFCSDEETASLMIKSCPFACDGCKREVEEVEVAEKAEEEVAKKEVEAVARKEEEVIKKEEAARAEAKEAARREVEAAMKEEKIRRKRSFAALIADAASADTAFADKDAGDVEKRGCKDFSPKCQRYAEDGLCGNRETSSLMSKTCPSSCGHCRKREMEARSSCKDTKAKCEVWAVNGMCKSDPDMEHFMAKTCPFACDLC